VEAHPGTLTIVDLGCADGFMLSQLAAAFPDRQFSLMGFDRFPKGMPAPSTGPGIRYAQVDLFSNEPLPVGDGHADIVIASAFVKHHPRTQDFLREAHRMLRVGGILVMLDPRPWVVHVGRLLSYFSREFTPSIWSERTIRKILKEQMQGSFGIEKFERYWMSPRKEFYSPRIEDSAPTLLRSLLGLHQSAVLSKLRSHFWSLLPLVDWLTPATIIA